jgi:hypothetical protein
MGWFSELRYREMITGAAITTCTHQLGVAATYFCWRGNVDANRIQEHGIELALRERRY